MQPDLALIYNSQDTANDNIVGYGWSLSIPYIQVLNKYGSQSIYNARYFTSSIDGELATTSASTSTYMAKVDDGRFDSYTFSNNVWTMYTKNGTRYTFGASDGAQENAGGIYSIFTYKWMLEEIRDTNNNYVRFVYTKDGSRTYPSQIIYTGNGTTDGIFTINFTLESRSDIFKNYSPLKFIEITHYRISKITASVNGNIVREYNLAYTHGNNGYRSLLSSIQENGWSPSGTESSLPAETFGYISSTTAFVWPAASPYRVYGAGWVVADANGNGVNDITNFYQTGGAALGSVLVQDQTSQLSPTPPDFWATDPYCTGCDDRHMPKETGVRFVDVNADGKADVADSGTASLYLNNYTNGSYSWATSTTLNGEIPSFSSGGFSTGLLGDVNADGLPDYVMHLDNSGGTLENGTNFGNGAGWDVGTTTIFVAPQFFSPTTGVPARLVDVTGEGLPFWLYVGTCQYALGPHTCFLPNFGDGWAAAGSGYDSNWTLKDDPLIYATTNPNGSAALYDRGIRFLDINGDGLPDLVRAYCVPTNIVSGGPALPEVACVKYVALKYRKWMDGDE